MVWKVGCAGRTDVWVKAETWEEATVEAAKAWGVRWGAVAAGCEKRERRPMQNGVCPRCGRVFNAAGELLCAGCRAKQGGDGR